MSRTFLEAIGCLLFIGMSLVFVYMVLSPIESAKAALL